MIYPASFLSLLMKNSDAKEFFNALPKERQNEVLNIEFKSSDELYDYITKMRNGQE